MDEAVRSGSLEVDGKIVVKTPTEWINANKQASAEAKSARTEDDVASKQALYGAFDAGVELNVSKAALEPVWYLPGELLDRPIACRVVADSAPSLAQVSPSASASPRAPFVAPFSRTPEECTPSFSLATISRLSSLPLEA